MNRAGKMTISILLIVTVLTMSISVFATDPSPSPSPTEYPENIEDMNQILWDESGAYLTWVYLSSMGIIIADNPETMEYTKAVQDELTELVEEYLASMPSVISIWAWTQPWLWSTDFWGNLRFNSNMLEDIEDFADFLRTKFNLTDNSSQPLRPIAAMGDVQVYTGGYAYTYRYEGNNTNWYYEQVTVDADAYIGFFYQDINDVRYITAITFKQNTSSVQFQRYRNGNWNYNITATYNLTTRPDNNESILPWRYYGLGGGQAWDGTEGIVEFPYNFYSVDDFFDAMQENNTVSQIGNMYILTNEIITPSLDPSYTSGDSVIIVDGQPQYQVIDWNGEVTVSNLPAVVSTGRVENPGLVEFFRPISALIDMAKTPVEIMVQIIYRLPVEVNVCIMSVMGAICLLGIIKIMREH